MDVFAALADPTRRSILEVLSDQGQLPASAIYDRFPVSPPAISQHLKVLREADLVLVEKRAQQRLYRVNVATMETVEAWVRQTTRRWNSRLDKLERVLNESIPQEGDDGAEHRS